MRDELSLQAREALITEHAWTETGWPEALAEVLEDVGEGAAEMVPDLAVWCRRRKDPVAAAQRLARLAVYTAEDPVETLTTFVAAAE